VKNLWLLSLPLIAIGGTLGGLFFFTTRSSSPPVTASVVSSSQEPPQEQNLEYAVHSLKHSVAYTLKIPAKSRFEIVPALSETVETPEEAARSYGAIAAINGGFFDPLNQKSTSFVVLNGKLAADPRQNERLVNNPDLAPYLDKIFDRSEFRRYQCGSRFQYAIARHRDPTPNGCQLIDALGGGPQLLPTATSEQEGFLAVANGEIIRDSLGSRQPNARSAVGITQDGSVVWVMVAQKSETSEQSGVSLQALAHFMKTLGIKQAMNLDGGSSSSIYYQGRTIYGKLGNSGKRVQRPVKSFLLVLDRTKTGAKNN